MHCLLCENLELAFEARRSEYIEATSLANYRISKRFAAYKNVEMERARTELEEHRSVCISVVPASKPTPAPALLRTTHQDLLRTTKQERMQGQPVGSAA
jgi:hypothetical protein